jgi:hypothetical protein
MKRTALRLAIALGSGVVLGGGATLWFFAQATRHVTTLQPPGVLRPDDAPSVPDRVRIMELVCRDVLSATSLVVQGAAKLPSVCFLGIGDGQDPTPELLAALDGLPMSVRPYSAAKWKDGRMIDLPAGTSGLAVTIRRMWMRTRDEVHVRVRVDAGGVAAPAEWVFTLTRADGQWKVTGREPSK